MKSVEMKTSDIKETVKEKYGQIAVAESSSCCGDGAGLCTPADSAIYTDEELGSAPEGSNLGLGCGNPTAIDAIREGQTVVDLGSGAGFDCFLASKKVGAAGKVIGVDMTDEMLARAKENAVKGGYDNVEFRRGEIENLPVEDNEADVVISNCVINLSPDKKKVFEEAARVLKPGGRLMVSDIVLLKELPEQLKGSVEAYVGCIAGALIKDDYLGLIKEAGFTDIDIVSETPFISDLTGADPHVAAILKEADMTPQEAAPALMSILSVSLNAVKPI